MATGSNAEAEKWKSKYYTILDRFDAREAEWAKSEELLNKALGRISILAEGQNPLIDHHLQALRVVLKEKFSFYRVDAVLSELFKIITEVDKKSKSKKTETQVSLSVLLDVLSVFELPKAEQKKRDGLLKQLEKQPDAVENIIPTIKQLIVAAQQANTETKSAGLITKLFAKKDKAGEAGLQLLSDAIASLPWPENQLDEKVSLLKAFKSCTSEAEFSTTLRQFKKLSRQWPVQRENKKRTENISPDNLEVGPDNESVRQQCLQQFVSKLKTLKPDNKNIQSINIADDNQQQSAEKLASVIASLIDTTAAMTQVDQADVKPQPELKELFIQLVEQLVVPIGLMEKADVLKQTLEEELEKNWRRALKKVVHFINEVRFQEYQEEGEYENFLQQITDRLQEMVQFIETENRHAEESGGKGSALNKAMVDEVAGLKQGVESAATLQELQSVVNNRLDAISEFVKQHSQLEQDRLQHAKEKLDAMQQKINLLEKQTAVLKVSLDKKNREAMYDALTGIPNRLFYEKRVQEDIGRWKRFDTPLSIAVWDVDKFKSVNDSYGHKAGDKVLKAVAQILNKRIRETDFLARYGGEEFVMLLPGTVEEETLRLANELRQAVENCAFHYNEEVVPITISCGISGFREGDVLATVFERADRALYQAKDSGRNRCVVAVCKSH